jgi:hypothetical protein
MTPTSPQDGTFVVGVPVSVETGVGVARGGVGKEFGNKCSILLYHRFGLDVQNYVELGKIGEILMFRTRMGRICGSDIGDWGGWVCSVIGR